MMLNCYTRNFIFSIALLAISFTSFAQCGGVISNLSDTLHVCKNTAVPLNPSVTIFGNSVLIDTFWTPGLNLTDSTIINPSVNVGTTDLQYTLHVTSVTANNLLNNGDFSLGNTGFTSSYGPGTGGSYGLLSNEAQYAVTTNPNLVHTNFASFGDHTTGTGNMMVINGASAANVNIWCQTINVLPNTTYDFSAWGATCVASAPAILQFSINGNLTGAPLALPLTTGVWNQFHTTWFSGSNTTITICITDQTAAASGNDFAIDDIEFKEICDIIDSVYLDVTNLTPSFTSDIHLGCKKDTVTFIPDFGSGDAPDSYVWSFGDGILSSALSPTYIYQLQNVYIVKLVTYANGCADSVSQSINLNHPIDAVFSTQTMLSPPNIPDNDSTCIGVGFDAFSLSVGTGIKHEWNWGDGTINSYAAGIISDNHNYALPGTYTLTLKVTDFLGCVDSAKINLFVEDQPFVTMNVSDSIICLGTPIFLSDSVAPHTVSFTYDFGDGKQLIDIHNPTHVYDNPSNYVITLTGNYAKCPPTSVSKTIQVDDYPQVYLGKDSMICPTVTKPILLNNLANAGSLMQWSTGVNAASILVTTPGYYWATATSSNGICKTTDSIWIKQDCYLNIPNSFSPNGDGLNDYFLPRELLSSGLKTFKMSIFNRWGEEIYNTNSLTGRGWDGKFGEKDQTFGVYIYVIDVVYLNGISKSYKGNVTLLR